MKHRARITLLQASIGLWAITAHAQGDWAQWFVQPGDSGTSVVGMQAMARWDNGEVVLCAGIGVPLVYERARFVRCDANGGPLAQWNLSISQGLRLMHILPLSDGTIACFGRRGSQALYLRLSDDGTPLAAKGYNVAASSNEFQAAVAIDSTGFFAVGSGGFPTSGNGLHARLALDGTLLGGGVMKVGKGYSGFNSIVSRAGGGHLVACGSNITVDTGYIKVVAFDPLANVEWARTFVDTGYSHSWASVFELPGGSIRLFTRYQQPGSVGPSMIALTTHGDPLWARKRVPSSGDLVSSWAHKGRLFSTDRIVSFGQYQFAGNTEEYVQVLDTAANEVALARLGPQTTWGRLTDVVPDDAGGFYLMGVGEHPLAPPGSYVNMMLARTNAALDLCSLLPEITALVNYSPGIDTTWQPGSGTITVTDLMADLVYAPTTAGIYPICLSTSTEALASATSVAVRPGPCTGCFTFTGDMDALLITDALGRVVCTRSGLGSNTLSVDLSADAPGVYQALVVHQGRTTALRLTNVGD